MTYKCSFIGQIKHSLLTTKQFTILISQRIDKEVINDKHCDLINFIKRKYIVHFKSSELSNDNPQTWMNIVFLVVLISNNITTYVANVWPIACIGTQ